MGRIMVSKVELKALLKPCRVIVGESKWVGGSLRLSKKTYKMMLMEDPISIKNKSNIIYSD